MEIGDHIYQITKGSPGSRGNRSLFGDADRMITITAEQIERVNLILSGVPGGIERRCQALSAGRTTLFVLKP